MKQTKEKIAKEKIEATWSALIQHAERNALLLISRDIDLIDAAVAVANDEKEAVQKWISEGSLTKPTENQKRLWENEPRKLFWIIIVQPFVLLQELSQREQNAFELPPKEV